MDTQGVAPNVGDHIFFKDKRRVRWEHGTVVAVSKQNPQVFHVLDHNPLLDCGDGGDPEQYILRTHVTVHQKRIEGITPANCVCDCGHSDCPTKAEYDRRFRLLRDVVKGDSFAIHMEERRIMSAQTEGELQAHLERLHRLEQKYNR